MTFVYIQILRFIAAAAVVFFHAHEASEFYLATKGADALQIFTFGRYGVDIFFVISGFIIYFSAEKAKLGAAEFIIRRIERIVPLYWILTCFAVVLALCTPALFNSSADGIVANLLPSLTFTTFATGNKPIVFVGWTLEYEMFFYLCVGVLLIFRSRPWDILIALFSLLVIAAQLAGVRTLFGLYAPLTALLLEFVFGVIVAKAILRHRLPAWCLLITAAAVGVLLLMHPMDRVILAGLPFAALVFAAAYASSRERQAHQSAVLSFASKLGDASYSIYLVQIFTVLAVCKAAARIAPATPVALLIFIAGTTTIAAGYAVYAFIERPILRACRKARRGSAKPALSAPVNPLPVAGER